ncbi:hypothetical protein OIU76_025113 [Salix suchowensis]|nr:hypothetical protein OIU76_025113 [Salix suchowensis]
MAASFSLLFIHHHHCCHFPPQILPARHLHSLLQLLPHLLHQWFHHWDEQAAALTSHPLYMHEETPSFPGGLARLLGAQECGKWRLVQHGGGQFSQTNKHGFL